MEEPGRERERERKGWVGAKLEGVMPKRLDAQGAPSGELDKSGGMALAIMEFRGSERPRTPEKEDWRGSEETELAAAIAY